ncbi:MAG: orotate phosphoribosyltransferase [Stellaceae bacterium]
MSDKMQRLLAIIREKSFLRGEFKLVSGAVSNYYLDLKPTMFDAEGASLLAELVYDRLKDKRIGAIGGLELGAVPIVVGVVARSWSERPIAGFVVRKEKKGHGTDNRIDGNFSAAAEVALMEDVTTTGGSVMQAVRAVRAQGGTVRTILTIVDREEGARANLAKEGLALDALFTAREIMGE